MVKRGSKYLRFALINAARMVCMNDLTFNNFKDKKIIRRKTLQSYSRTCCKKN